MRIKFLLENQTEESFYRLPGMDELLDDLKARGIAWTKDASNGSHEERMRQTGNRMISL